RRTPHSPRRAAPWAPHYPRPGPGRASSRHLVAQSRENEIGQAAQLRLKCKPRLPVEDEPEGDVLDADLIELLQLPDAFAGGASDRCFYRVGDGLVGLFCVVLLLMVADRRQPPPAREPRAR